MSNDTQMDWQQVVLNGGPPCFARLNDKARWYCGRAQRWEGHDGEHKFVSLADLLATVRKEAFKEAINIVRATAKYLGQSDRQVAAQQVNGCLRAIDALERASASNKGDLNG